MPIYHEVRRWTKSAKQCYERNCICSGCKVLPFDMQKRCVMKTTVIELVKILGTPPEDVETEITKELVEDLYLTKRLELINIYSILKTNKEGFLDILKNFGIEKRKNRGVLKRWANNV